jgi:hypothetical protein
MRLNQRRIHIFVYKILIKEARKFEIELDFVTHCAGANDICTLAFLFLRFHFLFGRNVDNLANREMCVSQSGQVSERSPFYTI